MYPELTQFSNWLKRQYSTSSASVHYSSDLALFFTYIKKKPSSITSQDVDRYVTNSSRKGNKPSTINRRLSALRTFYYFLSMTCDSPPACPVLSRHRLRKSHPIPRDVSEANVKTFMVQVESLRDKAIFLLMLNCGLRVGEVHRLSLDDLLFENPAHLMVHGKGGKQRIAYLSHPTQKALELWLESRPVSNDRAVFISEHGKRLTVSGIQYLLRGYCEKARIKLTAHQFRHTFGRRMAEANLPLTALQALLGHKSVRTTQIYVHLADQYLQTQYDLAIAKFVPPPALATTLEQTRRTYLPKRRTINWKSYLADLPDWLTSLIRADGSRHSQTHDPIQQIRNRLSQLSQFFRWTLSNTSFSYLGDITPKHWFAYVDIRLKAGIKPTSLNTALRAIQSFLKFAKESGYSTCERMLNVRPLKTEDLLPRGITELQLNKLLEQANSFDYAWILLMAHSGLRICEIRNLRWQNVDLQRRTIRIEESKGLRSRIVFLSSSAVKALKKLSRVTEYIFTYGNQQLSNRYCQSRLSTLGKRCSIHVSPHQLRRTCGTLLLNSGMSIFSVQSILGHKYVDTTLRYARIYDATVAQNYEQAVQAIEQTRANLQLK